MKITTKTGDGGETGLFGGERVKKSSVIMNALGDLDELNSVLGWVKCEVGTWVDGAGEKGQVDFWKDEAVPPRGGKSARAEFSRETSDFFDRLQDDIYKIMSFIGSQFKWHPHIEAIGEVDIEFLEMEIAKYEEEVGGLSKFIRPGVNEVAARLHIARSVCRRAERSYVGLLEEAGKKLKHAENLPNAAKMASFEIEADTQNVLKYLNRLSDLLFVMAYSRS